MPMVLAVLAGISPLMQAAAAAVVVVVEWVVVEWVAVGWAAGEWVVVEWVVGACNFTFLRTFTYLIVIPPCKGV